MATRTLLTIDDYLALDEPVGVRYELSDGKLIVTPSPNLLHNELRDELNAQLRAFVKSHKLGVITSGTDMQLADDVVRPPDVAFISAERVYGVDRRKIPVLLSPDLVIEIVSENDRADDLILKVRQYLAAGIKAVWLFYPGAQLAYRYVPGELEPEVRSADAGHSFEGPEMLPELAMPLVDILTPSAWDVGVGLALPWWGPTEMRGRHPVPLELNPSGLKSPSLFQ